MAPVTGSVTSTCKPTSTNSPSASTGGSIRSTPSVPCSASRAALPHRPMQSFTPVPGSILHLGGVGKNRIGKDHFPKACAGGGAALSEERAPDHIAGRVSDLPEPQPLIVTEHLAHSCR